ncbi:hypothetical protein BOX15_Mlig025697g1 [Macrostomum lignano]|uniref:Uncharacterized protein n=1 Tax=Macrostomum lignano TaxID=282301 RepID=A0A267FHI2_9PLAT|nr:hypothetical protein BOX15_Mlig025697g1 [Macrostomum lignano]
MPTVSEPNQQQLQQQQGGSNMEHPSLPASETHCAFNPIGCPFVTGDRQQMSRHYADESESHAQYTVCLIAELKQENSRLSDRVKTLSEKVDGHEQRIQRLEANLAALMMPAGNNSGMNSHP